MRSPTPYARKPIPADGGGELGTGEIGDDDPRCRQQDGGIDEAVGDLVMADVDNGKRKQKAEERREQRRLPEVFEHQRGGHEQPCRRQLRQGVCHRDPGTAGMAPAAKRYPRDDRNGVHRAELRSAGRARRAWSHNGLACGHSVDDEGQKAPERQSERQCNERPDPSHRGARLTCDMVGHPNIGPRRRALEVPQPLDRHGGGISLPAFPFSPGRRARSSRRRT